MGRSSINEREANMTRFEVTIPFKKHPWWTGEALAESKFQAVELIKQQAAAFGFKGSYGKVEVREIK